MSKVVQLRASISDVSEQRSKQLDIDAQLVTLAQAGESAAFGLLVQKYQNKIANVLTRYISEPADVSDLAQDVFIRAYRSLSGFRQESSFYTWLFRIAVNMAKTYHSSQGRRSDIERPMLDVEAKTSWVEHASPERLLACEQLKKVVFDTIEQLPDELKAAVTLREVDGLNYEEIAQILECPIGTVRSRIHRAREAIDKQIQHFV